MAKTGSDYKWSYDDGWELDYEYQNVGNLLCTCAS